MVRGRSCLPNAMENYEAQHLDQKWPGPSPPHSNPAMIPATPPPPKPMHSRSEQPAGTSAVASGCSAPASSHGHNHPQSSLNRAFWNRLHRRMGICSSNHLTTGTPRQRSATKAIRGLVDSQRSTSLLPAGRDTPGATNRTIPTPTGESTRGPDSFRQRCRSLRSLQRLSPTSFPTYRIQHGLWRIGSPTLHEQGRVRCWIQ